MKFEIYRTYRGGHFSLYGITVENDTRKSKLLTKLLINELYELKDLLIEKCKKIDEEGY